MTLIAMGSITLLTYIVAWALARVAAPNSAAERERDDQDQMADLARPGAAGARPRPRRPDLWN